MEGYWFLYSCVVVNVGKKHESSINAVKIKALRSTAGVTLTDKMQKVSEGKISVTRKRCNVVVDVVTKVKKGGGVVRTCREDGRRMTNIFIRRV